MKFDRRPGQSFNCLLRIKAFITIKTENLIAAFSVGWINKLVRIEFFLSPKFINRQIKHKQSRFNSKY